MLGAFERCAFLHSSLLTGAIDDQEDEYPIGVAVYRRPEERSVPPPQAEAATVMAVVS